MNNYKLQQKQENECDLTPKKLTSDLEKIIYLSLQIDQESEEIALSLFGPRPQVVDDNIKNPQIYGISERVDIVYERLETILKTLTLIRERL